MNLRREPFRLYFPLGILLGWVGVLPWLLFGRGLIQRWMGAYHALTMTEGFLLALAAGFLGTMIPRRTQSAPLGAIEMTVIGAGLVAVPLAMLADSMALAQVGYLLVLGTLLQFVLRRLRSGTAGKPPPPSFVLIPIGLACGISGAVLLLAFAAGAPAFALSLGRQLVQQGLLLGLVLALAPMLNPMISQGQVGRDPTPAQARALRALHLVLGALLVASFLIEELWSVRVGLLLRGGVALIEIGALAGLWRAPTRSGLHRVLFRLALLLIPIGLLAAGATPVQRIPLLHVTFISGLVLLAMAISMHVTFMHTGHEAHAERNPWPVAVVGGLTLSAAVVRVCAERFLDHYFGALTLAASFWLLGSAVWAIFLLRQLKQDGSAEA